MRDNFVYDKKTPEEVTSYKYLELISTTSSTRSIASIRGLIECTNPSSVLKTTINWQILWCKIEINSFLKCSSLSLPYMVENLVDATFLENLGEESSKSRSGLLL